MKKHVLGNGEIIRRRLQNRKFLMDNIIIEDESTDRRIEQLELGRTKPKCMVCGIRPAEVTNVGIIPSEIYVCLLCLNLYSAAIKRKLV